MPSFFFLTPALEVTSFSYDDIKNILKERINKLRINESIPIIIPHTEDALRILFELHDGNIREILNSLMSCVLSLQPYNLPIQIAEDNLRDILFQKVNEMFMKKLTDIERDILLTILENKHITPTQLSELTKKRLTNISSKYIPKLIKISAVRFKYAEGRNRFYEVTPEIKWWKLKREENEKIKTKINQKDKINEIIQKGLKEFI